MSGFIIPEAELRAQAVRDGMTHLSTGVAVLYGGKVLAVRRAADDYLGGTFELPGGGIDAGESFAESVAREIWEETGLRMRTIVGMFPGFEYSTPKKPRVRQFNFLVKADGTVQLSAEHDQFVWVDAGNLHTVLMSDAMYQCFDDVFRTLAAIVQ